MVEKPRFLHGFVTKKIDLEPIYVFYCRSFQRLTLLTLLSIAVSGHVRMFGTWFNPSAERFLETWFLSNDFLAVTAVSSAVFSGPLFANDRGDWQRNFRYDVGDVVEYRGHEYEALRRNRNQRPENSERHWALLPPADWIYRGEWDQGDDYAEGDVVVLGGSSFIALERNSGLFPDDGDNAEVWGLVALAGAPGLAGAQGPAGADGVQGALLDSPE